MVLSASTLTLATMLTAGTAGAVPIASDLSISGGVELSTTIGQSTFSDGNVSQTGELRRTTGGSTTTSAFSTTPGTADGADDGTTTSTPLTGALTDIGDGFGYTTDLNAAFQTGFNFNEGYDFIIDLGIDFMNSSATDTFTVTMRVSFSHSADADGADSFVNAGLDIEQNNVDERVSDLESDTLLGDRRNGTSLGTFGAVVSENDNFTFDVVLTPGANANVGILHQWEGGVFENPGASLFDAMLDITIDGIACSGVCAVIEPPVGMPEPGTIALLTLGLGGLAMTRRRRQMSGSRT